jgi:hypothetical protein
MITVYSPNRIDAGRVDDPDRWGFPAMTNGS